MLRLTLACGGFSGGSGEVALEIAYQYWQHKEEPQRKLFIHFDNAYHGDTISAMSVGGKELVALAKRWETLLIVDEVMTGSDDWVWAHGQNVGM